jgi:Eukaryotic initiation factor 4E
MSDTGNEPQPQQEQQQQQQGEETPAESTASSDTEAPVPATPSPLSPKNATPTPHSHDHNKLELHGRWTLWFDNPKLAPPGSDWKENLKTMGSFRTIDTFWRIFNNIKPASQISHNSNYSVFRYGMEPSWEDPSNCEGGKFVLTIPKKVCVFLLVFHSAPDRELIVVTGMTLIFINHIPRLKLKYT